MTKRSCAAPGARFETVSLLLWRRSTEIGRIIPMRLLAYIKCLLHFRLPYVQMKLLSAAHANSFITCLEALECALQREPGRYEIKSKNMRQ